MTPTQTKLLDRLGGNCHKWDARASMDGKDAWRAARAAQRELYREMSKPWAPTKTSKKAPQEDLRRGERLAPLALDPKLRLHANPPQEPSTNVNPRMAALLKAQATRGLIDPTGVRQRLAFDGASTAACAA